MNTYTFDSFFLEQQSTSFYVKKLAKYKTVCIDEYSQVPSRFFSLLTRIKIVNPDIQIKLFGEMDQCSPVELKQYDYNNSSIINKLCGSNIVKILYRFTRYDQSLYNIVMHFKEHQMLPLQTKNNKIGSYYTNITMTNEKRHNINKECMERFITEFKPQIVTINGIQWAVGMPLIAKVNMKQIKIFNSQMFKLVKTEDEYIVVERDNQQFKVLQSEFNDLMDYGFAVTVNRYQGSEIREHFNIHEMNKMNFNQAYTAISRGITLDKVHFQYTPKKFFKVKPNLACIEVKLAPHTLDGKIYMITDSKQSFTYIGSTVRTLEQRLKEHQEKPVNKKMAQYIKNKDIVIKLIDEMKCVNVSSMLSLENEYIAKYAKMADHNLVNIKVPKTISETKVQIIHQQEITKYQIKNNEKDKSLSIQYMIEGKKMQKKIRYSTCGLDAASKQMLDFRQQLIETYC